jgi:hypothetical protein
MSNSIESERSLGFLEWVFWLIEHAGRVNFVVVAEISGPVTPELLRKALDLVQSLHPLLQVRVAIQPRGRWLFLSDNVPPIPLRVVHAPSETWVLEAERDREERLPLETGPLCRCTLIQHANERATLLTTISHIIGDGISGCFLVRSILRAAGAVAEGKSAAFGAPQRCGSLDRHLPSWTRGVKGIWATLKSRFVDAQRRKRLGCSESIPTDSVAPFEERRTRLIPCVLDTDSTRRLLQRSRQEKSSLHGALAAAQLQAIAQEFGGRDAVTLSLVSGTNLRGRMSPRVGNDVLGLFASMIESTHRVPRSAPLWPLAREVSGELAMKIDRGLDLVAVAKWRPTLAGLRWWLPPTDIGKLRFLRLLSRRAAPASMISVIPRGEQIASANDYGPLAIESLHGFGAGPRTPLFSMSTISRGKLRWNFVYLEPIFSRERAQRIANRAVQEVRNATPEV